MKPEEQDWIDRAVSRDGMWEPPAQFVERVSLVVLQELPPPKSARALVRLWTFIVDVKDDLTIRIEGSLWALRQYRALLFGHL